MKIVKVPENSYTTVLRRLMSSDRTTSRPHTERTDQTSESLVQGGRWNPGDVCEVSFPLYVSRTLCPPQKVGVPFCGNTGPENSFSPVQRPTVFEPEPSVVVNRRRTRIGF